MTYWFTIRQLAKLKLPGLPTHQSSVARLAIEEGWALQKTRSGEPLARQHAGKGGGLEYHISLLPPEARCIVAAQALKQVDVNGAAPKSAPSMQEPTTARATRREARLAVLLLADTYFNRNRNLGRPAADDDFASRWNRGEIQTDAWLLKALPHVSQRSLRTWRKVRDEGRSHEIGGKGRRVRHVLDGVDEGAVATYIGAVLLKQPFLMAPQVRDLVEAQFGNELLLFNDRFIPLPSARSFQRYISDWRETNKTHILQHTNPDAFKSRARASGVNAYAGISRVNELWELDASPADVLLKGGRHSIYLITDVFSRRVMLHVTKTPRAESALALLRKAILAWGVPETLRTDNGSDFKSEAFMRALIAVGIQQDLTKPYTPEAKAIVERAIGTFQHMMGPLLPGFIGHNVTERKQIEDRKAFAQRLGETDEHAFCVDLDSREFQQLCNDWAAVKYGNRPHRSLGMSPNEKARSCLSPIRTIQNEHALALLLTPVPGGWRQVTKRGLQFDGGYYLAGALLPGQRVFCRMDAEDMGRLFVFDDEHGAFICEAICPERAGANPHHVLAATKAEQKRLLRDGLKDAKALARKLKPRHMIDSVLRLAAEKAAADGENVALFPKRQERHESAALQSARDALEGREAVSKPVENPFATVVESNVRKLPETPENRFRRFRAMERAIAAGADIDVEEALKLGNYQKTPEYLSMLAMERDFGSESNEVS